MKTDFCLFPWEVNCHETSGKLGESIQLEVFSSKWRHSAAQAPAHNCTKCQGAHPAGGQETLQRSACLIQFLSVSTPRGLGSILRALGG